MTCGIQNDIEDGTREYFRSLKGYKSLSKNEETELIRRYREEHDINARNMLVTSNLKFACKMANAYRGRGVSFDDLISEANDGLIESIDKFDVTKNVKLFTYSKWRIMLKMQEAIDAAAKIRTIEVPDNLRFFMEDGDDDGEGNGNSVEDTASQEEETENDGSSALLSELLSTLGERDRDIMKMYYGIGYDGSRSLKEISAKYGITRERVKKIIDGSMRKMRSESMAMADDYSD